MLCQNFLSYTVQLCKRCVIRDGVHQQVALWEGTERENRHKREKGNARQPFATRTSPVVSFSFFKSAYASYHREQNANAGKGGQSDHRKGKETEKYLSCCVVNRDVTRRAVHLHVLRVHVTDCWQVLQCSHRYHHQPRPSTVGNTTKSAIQHVRLPSRRNRLSCTGSPWRSYQHHLGPSAQS